MILRDMDVANARGRDVGGAERIKRFPPAGDDPLVNASFFLGRFFLNIGYRTTTESTRWGTRE